MLMIDFSLGGEEYTLPCEQVVEVIPRVELTPVQKVPPYFVGVCNLRGVPIPVVDLTLWVTGKESQDRLHTRIIVVEFIKEESKKMVGLVAEKVTRTTSRDLKDFIDAGVHAEELPFLGGISTEGEQTKRLLLTDPLGELLEPVVFSEVT